MEGLGGQAKFGGFGSGEDPFLAELDKVVLDAYDAMLTDGERRDAIAGHADVVSRTEVDEAAVYADDRDGGAGLPATNTDAARWHPE